MPISKHRSILMQLLNVYLLFVILVLAAGIGVNLILEQQLRKNAQASDQALAQEIALETSSQLRDAETALVSLSQLVMQASSTDEQMELLQNFQILRTGVEHVTWLDPVGSIEASWPQKGFLFGAEFSPPDVIQKARLAQSPVFEVGIAVETTFNAGVIIAEPAREADGTLKGIVVVSLSLDKLSKPISTVVQAQKELGRRLMISVIDDRGELVATPDHQRILQTVTDELPGSEQALQNHIASQTGLGLDGQEWLYSAVPVPYCGWAVVVQRPISEALAVVTQFHLWLLIAALFFGIGGLFFWLILLNKVIRPLHLLATQHQELPASEQAIPLQTGVIAQRKHEAQLLVDVQAAAVLLRDEEGILRVLASEGHSEHYNHVLSRSPENVSSSAVQALRYGKAVQKLLDTEQPWPTLSYDEGFRAVLAIPIISRHVGSVVLLVHRTKAHLFKQNEIDLLLMFANYATLAWEHAVLYERSDERLREIAKENKHLYQQASEEKQKLEAIMGSMSDGLVLTGSNGCMVYGNQSASTIVGLSREFLERQPITVLYKALCAVAIDPPACERAFVETSLDCVVKIQQHGQQRDRSGISYL